MLAKCVNYRVKLTLKISFNTIQLWVYERQCHGEVMQVWLVQSLFSCMININTPKILQS